MIKRSRRQKRHPEPTENNNAIKTREAKKRIVNIAESHVLYHFFSFVHNEQLARQTLTRRARESMRQHINFFDIGLILQSPTLCVVYMGGRGRLPLFGSHETAATTAFALQLYATQDEWGGDCVLGNQHAHNEKVKTLKSCAELAAVVPRSPEWFNHFSFYEFHLSRTIKIRFFCFRCEWRQLSL